MEKSVKKKGGEKVTFLAQKGKGLHTPAVTSDPGEKRGTSFRKTYSRRKKDKLDQRTRGS